MVARGRLSRPVILAGQLFGYQQNDLLKLNHQSEIIGFIEGKIFHTNY